MKFSIITPCFNSEKTIKRTLESVLHQTYRDYEYIIIDGGSRDRTLQIVKSYKDKFGDKLRVISESDNGIYDAMNKGIILARGELIGIVNSDDYYEINCLENVNKKCSDLSEYKIIYGMMRIINEKGEELSIIFNHHRNMETKIINHPTCFISKKLYIKYGMYDLNFKSAADYDFMLKMIKKPNVIFKPCYEILSNFTKGGMSSTYTGIQEDNKVRYKHGLVTRKKYLLTITKNYLKHKLRI